jgi:hypothetical protein
MDRKVIAASVQRTGAKCWWELLEDGHPQEYADLLAIVRDYYEGKDFQGLTEHALARGIEKQLPPSSRAKPQTIVRGLRILRDQLNETGNDQGKCGGIKTGKPRTRKQPPARRN